MAVVEKPVFADLSISFSEASSDQIKLELDDKDTIDNSSDASSVLGTGKFYGLVIPKGIVVPWSSGKTSVSSSMEVSFSAVKGVASQAFKGKGSGPGKNVRMFPPGSNSTLYFNRGNAKVIATDVPLSVIDEELEWVNTKEMTLQYSADSDISWMWVGDVWGKNGKIDPTPVFYKDTVILSEEVLCGLLLISYTTYFDRIEVTSDRWGDADVFLVAEKPNDIDPEHPTYASLLVSFGSDGTSTSGSGTTSTSPSQAEKYKDIIFTVLNYCTDAEVEGVTVTIDGPTGQQQGVTNVSGQCSFTGLLVGGNYTVSMSKTGFVASADDSLNNDSFTVQ
jgi:hypothetical protein